MSAPDEHRAFQFNELNQIDNALNTLRRFGITEDNAAYQALFRARGTALGKLGLVQPRTTTLLRVLLGLSPGELRLFRDAEIGWLVEAVGEPGAEPVRRYVSDEVAVKIITGELTHDEFMELSAPAAAPDN